MQLDPELELILSGKLLALKNPRGGPHLTRRGMIARMLNLSLVKVEDNGLDILQTPEAWLCRYSNMRYHQEREKRYKP